MGQAGGGADAAERAGLIEGEDGDGVVGELAVGFVAAFLPGGDAVGGVQAFEREAVLHREEPGPFADEEEVGRFVHDEAGELGDVADVFDARHRPAAERLPSMTQASRETVPTRFASPPKPTEFTAGSSSTAWAPARAASSGLTAFQEGQGGTGRDFAEFPGRDDHRLHAVAPHISRIPRFAARSIICFERWRMIQA